MVMNPINSSNLKSVGYNPQKATLRIEFQNGRVYRFSNISLQVFAYLMAAESKGKFFNENIKGHYLSRKLEPNESECDAAEQQQK